MKEEEYINDIDSDLDQDSDFNLNNDTDVEVESIDLSSQLMDKPFDPTKIKIETKTQSLDTLIKRISRKSVAMNTEEYFQRKDDLWDDGKQSRLIESILISFPLPAFFFDATDDNYWLIVDGLQRLSSIRNYCVLKTLRLTKLEFLTHLNGKGWNDLGEDLHRIIEETQVVVYKILPGTPTDVKFNIFKRINTGGLTLEPQEIRHALFQGVPAKFIAELAESKAFLRATRKKIRPHRMLDRDFVNRFLAFYLFGYENYQPDLDTFMSKAMAALYKLDESQLAKIKHDFEAAMLAAWRIFGKEAFRKVWSDPTRLPPINKALFDSLATQLALISDNERIIIVKNNKLFKENFRNLILDDDHFFASITSSTGDRNKVFYRHEKVKNIIQQIIEQHD
jgi:hypothetical protein